ncbi:hypothetical protein GC175_17150 [bacterium]|nr:hypothetical protein [bacterium]
MADKGQELPCIFMALLERKDGAAVTASVRTRTGSLLEEVIAVTAAVAWEALAKGLTEAAMLGVGSIVLFTNSPTVLNSLYPEFKGPSPQPVRGEDWHKMNDGWVKVPWGGDSHHWDVLRYLAGYPNRNVVQVRPDQLQKAKEMLDHVRSDEG